MTARRSVKAAIGALVIIASMSPDPAPTESSEPEVAAQVLGEIEVRGRQSGLSDGRSTTEEDAAPGLSTTELDALTAPTPDVGPPAEIAQPTAPAAPTPTVAPFPTAPADSTPTPPDAPAELVLDAEPDVEDVPLTVADRGAEAMELITYDWEGRLAGWRIAFLEGRDGIRGLTYSAEQRIEIFVRSSDSTWDIARVVAHELGHAVDLRRNSSSDRERWRDQRGLGGAPWWPNSGAADFATGAGDFAECFATWQVGSASLSQVGEACTADDIALVAELS